jgi:hypothetical protein
VELGLLDMGVPDILTDLQTKHKAAGMGIGELQWRVLEDSGRLCQSEKQTC